MNAPTLAEATTFWRRPDCFIYFGDGFCGGPFHFVLAEDGAMRWSLSASVGQNVGGNDRWGVSTWTRIGDTALALNDLPFEYVPSKSLNNISGSISSAIFYADFAQAEGPYAYSASFTLQTGELPGWCKTSEIPPEQWHTCDGAFANATATCTQGGDGTCEFDECVAGFSDCDGDLANGCEASGSCP